MSGTVDIRDAVRDDLPALRALYNHYVDNSHFTFDTEAVSVQERSAWFDQFDRDGVHRLLVAVEGGQLCGYASSSAFHYKPVYASSVEGSIYVSPAACSRGVGRRLYGELIGLLEREPGVHRLYAGVTLPNEPSLALHRSFGFRQAGVFSEVGQKGDRFWDLCWLERAV